MRKALIVGINHYNHIKSLNGCVNDAHEVNSALERDADGTVNFSNPKLLTSTGPSSGIDRQSLKKAVRELFEDDAEIAVFYFSGHGYLDGTGAICARVMLEAETTGSLWPTL